MDQGALGRDYEDGDIIVRQGEQGDNMFVIQEGKVEVLKETDGKETRLRIAGEGEFMGEMAIFERVDRSATRADHRQEELLASGPRRSITGFSDRQDHVG